MNPGNQMKIMIHQDLENKEFEAILEDARNELLKAITLNLDTIDPKLPTTIIQERINSIFSILSSSIVNLSDVSADIHDYRSRLRSLVVLHDSMQPNMFSKLAKTGLFNNTREQIKGMLNGVHHNIRETIDPFINNYLAAQRDLLASYIAMHNALELSERMQEMRHKYPDAQLEIIILKRHEVCSDLHKGYGFNPDTGLDALHFSHGQSEFELSTSKSVQNQQLQIMKKLGYIDRVEMIVSPVKRAYETALFATFSPEFVDKVTVDNYFAEEQMNTTLISSGRAYRLPSDVANDFVARGYRDVRHGKDFIIHGENKMSFLARRNEAVRRLLFSEIQKKSGVPMKIVVGHGGMNHGIMVYLKESIKNNNIPPSPKKLDFGGQYSLIIAKDKDGHILALDDVGKMNRYGFIEQKSREQIADTSIKEYIEYLEKSIQNATSMEQKAMFLFRRCMIEPDLNSLIQLINKAENLSLMLDMLPLFQCESTEDVERADCMLDILIEAHYKQVEKRIQEQKKSFTFWITSSISNYASGKFPETQIKILDQLRLIRAKKPEDILQALEDIMNQSEKECKEGKVTNLCRAKITLEQRKKDLNPMRPETDASESLSLI